MRIEGTNWYSAVVAYKGSEETPSGKVTVEPVYGYRLILPKMGKDENAEAEIAELEKIKESFEREFINGDVKIMDHDEEGCPAGRAVFEVSDPDSISKLESDWGRWDRHTGRPPIALDVNRFKDLKGKSFPIMPVSHFKKMRNILSEIEENKPLNYKNENDWDRVRVQLSNGKVVDALRINLDRMSDKDEDEMMNHLQNLGVDKRYLTPRVASTDSGHVKAGDRTIRIRGAANLERMGVLFNYTQYSGRKWEWKNLNNWAIDRDKNGNITNLTFNDDNLTKEGHDHMVEILDDLGVKYARHHPTNDRPYMQMNVFGEESIKKLQNFTRLWTINDSPRTRAKGERE